VVGVGLIIAEAHLGTHGILGACGVLAIILSGLLLYDTNSEAFEISAPVVIIVGLVLGGLLAFGVKKVVEARKRPVVTGWEEMVGATGEVRQPLDPVGEVFVHGALWRARLPEEVDDGGVPPGVRVRVESVDGLTLMVRPVEIEEEGTS
jgi:membrane-bound serine protease (ClpP class)